MLKLLFRIAPLTLLCLLLLKEIVKNYETVELTRLVLMGNWDPQLIAAIHQASFLVNNVGTVINVDPIKPAIIYYNFETPFIVSDGAVIDVSSPTMIDI